MPELEKLPKKFVHKPWEAPPDALEAAGVTLGQTYPHRIETERLEVLPCCHFTSAISIFETSRNQVMHASSEVESLYQQHTMAVGTGGTSLDCQAIQFGPPRAVCMVGGHLSMLSTTFDCNVVSSALWASRGQF